MNATHLVKAGACAALVAAAGLFGAVSSEAQTRAPRYEVDANWPKPFPNQWVIGGLGGLCVDRNDHVIILNRQDVLKGELNAGSLAPSIIEFDPEGNVVNSWGDPKLLDPRLHSCHVDAQNNIWIGSAPSGTSARRASLIHPMARRRARRSTPTPRSSICRRASMSTARMATSMSPMAKGTAATSASP
jgi:hypothetical protein